MKAGKKILEKINNCPVCNNTKFKSFNICKDFTVSKESFAIVECQYCYFKFTNPRPSEDIIHKYYHSKDYISHSDTKKGLINKVYHIVRKITLRKKLKLINKCYRVANIKNKTRTLLDIGCGTGYFLKTCKDNGWMVYGIEPDNNTKNIAIQFTNAEIESDLLNAFNDKAFDMITLWHTLEHIHQVNETIKKTSSLLKAGGTIIIAVPNSDSLDASIYKEYWAGYDVPRHLYHFTPQTMHTFLKNNDLKITDILPMKYDPYYISMLSEKYKTGKINYFKALVNGYRSNRWAANHKNNFSSIIYIVRKRT